MKANSKIYWEYINSRPPQSSFQKQALIGIILGDGSQNTQNGGKSFRVKFEWGGKNKDYAYHVFYLFKEYILMDVPQTKIRLNSNDRQVTTWRFNTISSPIFNEIAMLLKEWARMVKNLS